MDKEKLKTVSTDVESVKKIFDELIDVTSAEKVFNENMDVPKIAKRILDNKKKHQEEEADKNTNHI